MEDIVPDNSDVTDDSGGNVAELAYIIQLYNVLSDNFIRSELQEIMFYLGIPDLPGETNQDIARELVLFAKRRGRIPELVDICRRVSAPSSFATEKLANIQEEIAGTDSREFTLHDLLVNHFSEGELRTLVFHFGIDYDDLPAISKADKARELIKIFQRRTRISELIGYCRKERPKIRWEDAIMPDSNDERSQNESEHIVSSDDASTSPAEQAIDAGATVSSHAENEPQLTDPEATTKSRPSLLDRLLSNYHRLEPLLQDIKNAYTELSKADSVQEIAASQTKILSNYYLLVLDQADRSFLWAIIASAVGLIFFVAAITFLLLQESLDVAVVSLISGALIEIISGINFYLFNKTTSQFNDFHIRLESTQKFLLGNSMCDGLDETTKQETLSNLIHTMIETKKVKVDTAVEEPPRE